MSFFKGYIRLKGKQPLDKFKNAELRTLEEVKKNPEYAGVLASDAVLIDVDDAEQAEKLLDVIEAEGVLCQVRQTTRGMHFFFKNDGSFTQCSTGSTLAIGLRADIKVGSKNSYSVLKYGGKERSIIYDILEGESYSPVPKWLRVVRTSIDLVSKAEGDGRNNALFAYIMPLQEAGFAKDEIIDVLRIVNKYIFDKPLSKNEFETITRDEAFETALVPTFMKGKKFLFEQFANYLVAQHHLKRINGQLHLYKNGVYVSGALQIERAMIDIIPTLSAANRTEVAKYLEVLCCDNTPISSVNLIAFSNGILDISTGDLLPFSPDVVITNIIGWEYRKDAYSDIVDKTLTKLACGDKQIRALLEEAVGYCFFRRNELRKAFLFTGEKRNGKSTFINMLEVALGEDNISTLDMHDIGDRFRTAELFGKLANLGDDIGDGFIDDTSVFKKVVSGEKVIVERKGKDPFAFSNYAKFIFSANDLPRFRDRSNAVLDRLILIPFDATFSKDDPDFDPFIKDKLTTKEAIEYLIALGVEALRRILVNKSFTHSAKVEAALKGYNEELNPIIVFFEDHAEDDFTREPVSYWYSEYTAHCAAYGCMPISRTMFSRQVVKNRGNLCVKVRKFQGKTSRYFVEK